MPDINMQVFEEAKRNQLVTEVDIQTQAALDDYQVPLLDIANPTKSQDNVVIDRFGEFLPHWNESLDFDTWVKMSMEVAGKHILILRGNLNVSSASNSNNVFNFFDDFSGDLSKWTTVQGTWGISGGELHATSTETPDRIKAPVSISNFSLEGDIRSSANSGAGMMGMIFGTRSVSYSIYWAGVSTSYGLIENSAVFLIENTWVRDTSIHTFKLSRDQNSLISYYLDGNLKGSITDASTQSFDNVMLESHGVITKYFDNIRVRKYHSPEPTYSISTPKNIAVALKSLGRTG